MSKKRTVHALLENDDMQKNEKVLLERIKKIKERELWTWIEVAKRIKVSYWTLMRMSGKCNKFKPSMNTLRKIRDFFITYDS
jgi:hypothetical protein